MWATGDRCRRRVAEPGCAVLQVVRPETQVVAVEAPGIGKRQQPWFPLNIIELTLDQDLQFVTSLESVSDLKTGTIRDLILGYQRVTSKVLGYGS